MVNVASSGGAPFGPGVLALPGCTIITLRLFFVALFPASLAVRVCAPMLQALVTGTYALKLPLESLCAPGLPGAGLLSSRKVIAELLENFCPLICKTVPFAPAGVFPTR